MPDGSERKGTSWETSPLDVAKEVSKSLSERVVIAKARQMLSQFEPWLIMFHSGRWKFVGFRETTGGELQT